MSASTPKPGGVFSAIAGFLGFSVLAGVLVTAMVTPALAVTSMTASSTLSIFEELPDYLEIGQQSQRNAIYATQGGQWVKLATVFDQNREEASWDNVSQFAKDAAVAAEDRRFYEHGGVDLAGIMRAAVNNLKGGGLQGASSIDQQLVKQLAIQDAVSNLTGQEQEDAIAAAQANSIDRKLREAKLAIGLEKRYTKDEILLAYLNIAGYGGNTYGIESAAQQYYSTTAKDLTLAQAASLIAIVQSPEIRKPNVPDNWERNKSRRDVILANMLEEKMIDQAQYDEAIATPVDDTTVKISSPQSGCLYAIAAKFFCAYVVQNVKNLTALGATEDERRAAWKRGGYSLYTTIDLDQNVVAENILAARAPATETRFALGASASSIEVGTGRIKVMAQNKTYDNTEAAASDSTKTSINFNTDAAYGGSTGFQVGSSYKLFTLVDWLKKGHGLNEIVDGSPREYSLPATCYGKSRYLFKNDGNGNPGRITVMRATAGSVNAAFANMASKLDLCDIRATATSMGVHRADGDELKTNPTMILGTDEIAPLTMANAYATVANKGVLCQPIAVDKVVDRAGTELVGQEQECAQAITPEVAAGAAKALQGVMSGGTGSAANPRDGTALIGKTGTADALSTFIVGSSTKVATAVWVGNISGDQSLRKISINGINGGQLRFSILKTIQASLDQSTFGSKAPGFPEPPASVLSGSTQGVPDVAGQTVDAAKTLLGSLGLDVEVGATVASSLAAGLVVATDPPASSRVTKGTTITLSVSDGSLARTMPIVVGASLKDAVKQISAAGLDAGKISVTFVSSTDALSCSVVSSNPVGGSVSGANSNISLTVNGGTDGKGSGCA